MRVVKRNPWLAGLGVLLAMLVLSARTASADASTDRAGSIIVFPKVIADGTRDTLIQISNVLNQPVFAHCVYLDASRELPNVPPGPNNPRRCVEHDYVITLTRQQPTIWRVSTGRLLTPFDSPSGGCQIEAPFGKDRQSCPGLDPGNVPPQSPFEGNLLCVVVDGSGAPIGSDALKGEAIIESVDAGGADGLISAYNAVSISQGTEGPNGDQVLELNGVEYAQCPDELRFTHLAEGVEDPVIPTVQAFTELTLMPCTIDYETQAHPQVAVQFTIYDDTELATSTSTLLDCWFNEDLGDIGTNWNPVRSTTYQTKLRPQDGNRCRGGTMEFNFCTCPPGAENDTCPNEAQCGPGGTCAPAAGLLGIAETFRVPEEGPPVRTGSSAINLHGIGVRQNDTIFLQGGASEGICEGGDNDGNACSADLDCLPGGTCNFTP